ncbi:hypothetical protein [Nocardioides donggukensis]|uniref:Peptidase S55 domain-containing protein n=1 Tax=Nocardioides donggukensis TaxID=2774019 RepID=A0A927K416_9ACTN|nr:hypothetical protein [Nocardioides donggukensis]MBD8870267.1 hypothetical protein [Nocardioides donggukensis]
MTSRGVATRPSRIVISGLAAAGVCAAALAPISSAPAEALPTECQPAFPPGDLVEDQAVTGLTVTRGSTPEEFTGTHLGIIEDGIAPGVDMILARLSSPTIDEAGIWQGMSGSPVYDPTTGDLIGAVSYGLSWGPSPVAGLTPAADMLDLLPDTEGGTAPRVALPRRLSREVVGSGAATSAQASSGMRRLPTPVSVSGLSPRRFEQLQGWLDDHGTVTRATGSAGTSAVDIPIVPGGNVAASMSYGTLSSAAVGTVSVVCGDQVLGFGHPFAFAGETTYSMHGADAVTVQADPVGPGFKVANLGAPNGTVVGDRLAGIRGVLGETPTTYDVSTTARYAGRVADGTTHVSVEDMVADLSLGTAIAVHDRALDRIGKGSATATWTVRGEQRDGTPFELRRSDAYADTYDISVAPALDLAGQMYALLGNQTDRVTITSVSMESDFADDATRWRLGRVFTWAGGRWVQVTDRDPVLLTAGRTRTVKIELTSRDHDSRFVKVPIKAPRKARGQFSVLKLTGGGSSGGGDFFFYGSDDEFFDSGPYGGGPATVPQLVEKLSSAPRNDDLLSKVRFRGTGVTRTASLRLDRVVSGRLRLPVFVR